MSRAKAQEAIKEWRVLCKAHMDMQRKHRTLFGSNAATKIEYSGVVDARLQLMLDVEVAPLLKGHTFPMKEILFSRIAEEANSAAVRLPLFEAITTRYVQGCAGSLFQVKAFFSIKLGWEVTTIQTREVTKANDYPTEELFMMVKKRWRMRMRPLWRRMILVEK
jgi:hypothetical protein